MIFALDCLGKTKTDKTEYAGNNNEIILNRAINPSRPAHFVHTLYLINNFSNITEATLDKGQC